MMRGTRESKFFGVVRKAIHKIYNKRAIAYIVVFYSLALAFLYYVEIRAEASDDVWMFYADDKVSSDFLVISYDEYWTNEEDNDHLESDVNFYDNGVPGWHGFVARYFGEFVNNWMSCTNDISGIYSMGLHYNDGDFIPNTFKVFTAPYSGYFNICCTAPKGANSRIDCGQHHEVWGSYGSYIQGQVYLNQGEKLIIVMGNNINPEKVTDKLLSDDEDNRSSTTIKGVQGCPVFVFKYVNSDNLLGDFNFVNSCMPQHLKRSYNGEILLYRRGAWDDERTILPNCELLMVCGGGYPSESFCARDGSDWMRSGEHSAWWYDSTKVEKFVGVKGAYSDIYLNWFDASCISDGYVVSSDASDMSYEGFYVNALGYDIPISGAIYGSGGNNVSESWVKIMSVGNYVHYDANYPSGVTGSGTMLATRVSRGSSAPLRENTYNAGDNYVFQGWATSVDRANLGIIDYAKSGAWIGPFDSSFTGDMTLYAVWRPNNYKIQYIANPPSGYTYSGTMNDKEVEIGCDCYLDANNYSVSGYIFNGWSTSSTGVIDYLDLAYVSPRTTDLVLYAKWKPILYNVRYDKGLTNM